MGGYPPYGMGPGVFPGTSAAATNGRLPLKRLDGRWEYTSTEVTREEEGFDMMETYIRQRQNTFTQYILMQLNLDLCKAS